MAKKTLSYFEERMKELGVTPENNKITLIHPDAEFPMKKEIEAEVFSEDEKGNIRITVYDVYGRMITYRKKAGKKKLSSDSAKIEEFYITRLKAPFIDKKGDKVKHLIPKGAGTHPFFPPPLLDKFKNKEKIKTLVLTEGYFKAFKGAIHGIDIVGLSSITHYRDKETKELHGDILDLIKNCEVENVIWLQDGDCRDLSEKAVKDGKDLYIRPSGFFNSARNVKELLSEIDIQVFFANIISDSVSTNPKGLDDLFIEKMKLEGAEASAKTKGPAAKKKAQEEAERQAAIDLVTDLLSLSKTEGAGRYFYKLNVSYNLGKLQRYFHINSAENFHSFHQEKIGDTDFVFHGTKYHYNKEKNELEVIIPAAARLYFRVGDQYYKWVKIPDKHNDLIRTFNKRQKSTLFDDHGKKFIEHVPKYEAFCNTPDHVNFQQTPHSCYNLYAPFEHNAEEGDCSVTIDNLKHIFGDGVIKWINPKTKETHEINEVELGLDYIQLLYQKPTQKLPILCLVSKTRNTGKTTFANYLKLLFTNNMAIVGNSDLANDFNAHWASKLIICCDETKIDKQVVVERIKSLSTANRIFMNAKGKDQSELEFFGKFILLTNNEENFIYVDQEETRYWIRSIPGISSDDKNVNIESEMIEEIPAFLYFLNRRKMVTEWYDRMWFDPQLIKTDALEKVVRYSQPVVEKEIRINITEMFRDFGCDEIFMGCNEIRKEFFNNRYEQNYIQKILREKIGVDNYMNKAGKYVVKRYDYPKVENTYKDGQYETNWVDVKCMGRPFVFKRDDFLTKEEQTKIQYDIDSNPELEKINKSLKDNGQEAEPAAKYDDKTDDDPF